MNSSARQVMISKSLFITNRFEEKLEVLKECQEEKKQYPTVLFVPGLAMDLHEWDNSFDEIAKLLVNNGFLTYRFSFAGCGKSAGDFKEMTITRQAKQVKDVLDFVRKDELVDKNRIAILAQSMGGPSTIQAFPLEIKSLVLLSAVFDAESCLVEVLKERNAYNPAGVSYVPRSDGSVTEIGSQLWEDLQKLDLGKKLKQYSPSAVLVVHGELDTKVSVADAQLLYQLAQGRKELQIYPKGDHGFTDVSTELRRAVLDKIVNWFEETL